MMFNFGRFGITENLVVWQSHDGQKFPIRQATTPEEAQAIAQKLNQDLHPKPSKPRYEALEQLAEDIAELTNDFIADNYGSEFDWENHVGINWDCHGDRPYTPDLKEKYLLKSIWDIRHECNDILHYLSEATQEDLREILSLEAEEEYLPLPDALRDAIEFQFKPRKSLLN